MSRSTVSREAMEAAAAELERLLNRRFEEVELLILYIDGMVFGDHHVIAAVGVDAEGHKHVLGIQEGATENAAAVQDLLEGLVRRGVQPGPETAVCDRRARRPCGRRSAPCSGPSSRCSAAAPTSCATSWTGCRSPERDQVRAAMRAAWRLDPKTGRAKLGEVGPMVGARLSGRGGQLTGGSGGMFQPSTGWGFRLRCIAVWPPPISSRVRRRE